jgi:hypothetical protein
MKLKQSLTIGLMTLGFASAAAAQDGATTESLSLEELKAKCTELSSNQQLKPFNAVVTCREVSLEWREMQMEQPETIAIENAREIGATFRLKGFEVPYGSESVQVEPTVAACTVLEEYEITIPAVDVELSCDALNQVASLAELCTPAIEERIQDDPSIMQEQRTGRTFNTCVGLQQPEPEGEAEGEAEEGAAEEEAASEGEQGASGEEAEA